MDTEPTTTTTGEGGTTTGETPAETSGRKTTTAAVIPKLIDRSPAMAALWEVPKFDGPRVVSEADLASHEGMIQYHPWSLDTQKAVYSQLLDQLFDEVETRMFDDEVHIPRDLKAVVIPLILNTRGFHPYYRDLAKAEDDPGTNMFDHRFLVDLHFEVTKQTMGLIEKGETSKDSEDELKVLAELVESMKALTLEPTDGHTQVRTVLSEEEIEVLTATRKNIADPRFDKSMSRVVALVNYGPLMTPDSGWKQEIVVHTSMNIYMACCLLGTEYRYQPGRKWPGWSDGAFGECVVFWSDGYLPRWDAADKNRTRVHTKWGVRGRGQGKSIDVIRITVDMSEGVNTVWFQPFSGTKAKEGTHVSEDPDLGIIVDRIDFKFHLGFALQDIGDQVRVLSDRTWA